jgi:hypothetical protein
MATATSTSAPALTPSQQAAREFWRQAGADGMPPFYMSWRPGYSSDQQGTVQPTRPRRAEAETRPYKSRKSCRFSRCVRHHLFRSQVCGRLLSQERLLAVSWL